MIRYYIAEFTEVVVVDMVARPVLPWDGLNAAVHCVYPRGENGRYLESYVVAAVEADDKVHEQIAASPGVTVAPDDPSMKLKDVPVQKRTEVEQKAVELRADTKDVSGDTPVKDVIDLVGKQLKPTFDLSRLKPMLASEKVVDSDVKAGR